MAFLVEMVVDRDLLPERLRVSVLMLILHIAGGLPHGAHSEHLGALLPLLDEESEAIQAAVAWLLTSPGARCTTPTAARTAEPGQNRRSSSDARPRRAS